VPSSLGQGVTPGGGEGGLRLSRLPLPDEGTLEAGKVVALTPAAERAKAAFGVCTGDGILGVLRVQPEGKRAMSAAEFLRGQRQFIGAILPSS